MTAIEMGSGDCQFECDFGLRGAGCTVVVVCHVGHFAKANVNLSERMSCERDKLEEVHSIFLKLQVPQLPFLFTSHGLPATCLGIKA